jgi:hypothetical protein
MLFRAQSAGDAWLMAGKVSRWAPGNAVAGEWFYLLCVLLVIHAFCFWNYREDLLQRLGWPGRVLVVSGVVGLIAALGATGRPFIYFQF